MEKRLHREFQRQAEGQTVRQGIRYSMTEIRMLTAQCSRICNQIRPHSSLNYRPPTPRAILPVEPFPALVAIAYRLGTNNGGRSEWPVNIVYNEPYQVLQVRPNCERDSNPPRVDSGPGQGQAVRGTEACGIGGAATDRHQEAIRRSPCGGLGGEEPSGHAAGPVAHRERAQGHGSQSAGTELQPPDPLR